MANTLPIGVTASDLAPADFRSKDFDWTGLCVRYVRSTRDERFDLGYQALWDEFGSKNEMEQRDVISKRLSWKPEIPINNHALLYDMIVVMDGNHLAAVRDHTAVVDLQNPLEPVIVHLSHLLVMPQFRGTGLAGWLRAMPIKTARDCLVRSQQSSRNITLVAEMEPADLNHPDRFRRLSAYEKVGFVKIDPSQIDYLQPDFRPISQIDKTGGPNPVHLSLIIRRVLHENESTITTCETHAIVRSLYTIYQQTFRTQDMQPNWDSLKNYPQGNSQIALIPPTKTNP